MSRPAPKLLAIGLQQTFLQMVHDQIAALFGSKVRARSVALNELEADPPEPGETILYFNRGLRVMVEKVVPADCPFILARREPLIFNMRRLFNLPGHCRILVVNDVRTNTDDMTGEMNDMGLPHTFLPFYPDKPLPENIDYVVTAGERVLVPRALKDRPLINVGQRFISLDTVFRLFRHFGMDFEAADLSRHYMRTMMTISEKWPVLGQVRFRYVSRLGRLTGNRAGFSLKDFTANGLAMKTLVQEVNRMAATDRPVLVFGRAGTGKTRISQALHNASPLDQGPFVAINCAARPRESLEKELFGWEEQDLVFKGLFEEADQGTLCIEEVGQLPPDLQARLLQALVEGEIIRSGGQRHVPVKARIVVTSSLDIEELKAAGFEPALLLAMTAHVCRLPTLSERMEDFDDLISFHLAHDLNRPDVVLSRETVDILKAHPWEGNVQELFNVIQHMVCMAGDQVPDQRFLPYYINRKIQLDTASLPSPAGRDAGREHHFRDLAEKIGRHGFLDEYRAILSVYQSAKVQNRALGRLKVLETIQGDGYDLSVQKLRLRLERMNEQGLLCVRPGRGGTTLSDKGEAFLGFLSNFEAGTNQKELQYP